MTEEEKAEEKQHEMLLISASPFWNEFILYKKAFLIVLTEHTGNLEIW
jgi:hypothetical protein